MKSEQRQSWWWGAAVVRLVGVGIILYLATRGRWTQELPARLLAVGGLSFAWLLATGTFGWGRLDARDWSVAPVLGMALIVRLLLVRAGNSEIRVYYPLATFGGGWAEDKHSVLYDGWRAVFMALWGPSHSAFMAVNAIVGALTVVPLYLFVRRRFDDRLAALLGALFFGVHPLIARYAASDAHYSFILFFLFSGLAFLADVRGWRELFAGCVCLGAAAALRIEGAAYLALSLLLVRWRAIASVVRADRRARIAALAAPVLAIALAVGNLAEMRSLWSTEITDNLGWIMRLTSAFRGPLRLLSLGPLVDVTHAGDGCLLGLFWLGMVAAIARRRFRAGLLVGVAAFVLVFWVLRADTPIRSVEHRFNVVWALQMVGAGLGAAWAAELLPSARWRQAAAGTIAAATIVWVPLRHLGEMRREYAFNTEYELVRRYVAPRNGSGPCGLLYFNDGDMGLNNPGGIVPGVQATNCVDEDCLARARQGGCLYLLEGIGCNAVGTTPDRRQGRALKDVCAEFVSKVYTRPLAERSADFIEAYGRPAPPGKFPPSGTVGIYEITGVR